MSESVTKRVGRGEGGRWGMEMEMGMEMGDEQVLS